MACLFGHKWDGCKCKKCNAVRDEEHQFIRNGCYDVCSVCGSKSMQATYHQVENGICTVCNVKLVTVGFTVF